jgi:hypothetical protein
MVKLEVILIFSLLIFFTFLFGCINSEKEVLENSNSISYKVERGVGGCEWWGICWDGVKEFTLKNEEECLDSFRQAEMAFTVLQLEYTNNTNTNMNIFGHTKLPNPEGEAYSRLMYYGQKEYYNFLTSNLIDFWIHNTDVVLITPKTTKKFELKVLGCYSEATIDLINNDTNEVVDTLNLIDEKSVNPNCGGNNQPPCDNECRYFYVPEDGVCVYCGDLNTAPCKYSGCKEGGVKLGGKCISLESCNNLPSHKFYKEDCISCGNLNEPYCDFGCNEGYFKQKGVCVLNCSEGYVNVGEECFKDCLSKGLLEQDDDCVSSCSKLHTLSDWRCVRCGFLNQIPCENGCNDGLDITNGICTHCEVDGNTPCENDCIDWAIKKDGVCVSCGWDNRIVCEQGCKGGYIEKNGICISCGYGGQEPCYNGCNEWFIEINGVCVSCGDEGSSPCPNGWCKYGFVEKDGVCS